MIGDAGGSNTKPIGPAFRAEKSEAAAEESWINSCLALDESNTAAASSADSNPRSLPDTFHGDWAPLPSEYFSEPEQQEPETSPVKRELSQENGGGDGFRPRDLADDEESPGVSLNPATEDDVANIFRVWDLNTEDPELEKGTLTDILKASLAQALESPSDDGKTEELVESVPASLTPGPSDDGLDLRELEKELQEPESVERLIAAMADLNLYVSFQNGG